MGIKTAAKVRHSLVAQGGGDATASHAVELPAAESGGLAEWYHLLPSGTFKGRDGRGPYTLGAPQAGAVMEAFSRLECDLPVDYEHQSIDAKGKSGPAPAAGWIKELASRRDGIWGRIEWTPEAGGLLRNKEYRYLSPVFVHDAGGRVKAVTMAALTHTPNLHLHAAASRQKGSAMEDLRERICCLLGLPVTATDDELSAHLDRLKEMVAGQAEGLEAAEQMRTSLGLDGKATMPEIAAAVRGRADAGPDPGQFVPMDMFQAVNARLSQLEGARATEMAEGAVQAAMSAGKIAPAQRDWAVSYASRDLKGFQDFVGKAPAILSPGSRPAPKNGTATGALSPDQKAVAAAMGIDPALYLKTLENQEEA